MPANVIPDMLAPKLELAKLASCQLKLPKGNGSENRKLKLDSKVIQIGSLDEDRDTDEFKYRIDKLFSKLDLSGCERWTDEQQQAARGYIVKHHKIFAVEDNELGRTNLVKHTIRLNNYIPFKERYRRIPPHQYEEVKKHLQ